MAEQSPAKKLRKQVKGFLCDVSPIKDKKKPYFDAVLKHQGEVSKVLSFRPEDHMLFHNAETSRSLVTLEDVILQPSSESSRKMDVFYTHSSKMSSICEAVKVSELLNMQKTSKKVNINVKIIQEVLKGSGVIWDGQHLPKTEYTVADATGSVSLTVWREHDITLGEWYNITNVSIRDFTGKTSLSTTKNTQITNIPSQGPATAAEVPTEIKTCDIIGANIEILFLCPHYHKLKDVKSSNPTEYCLTCKTYFKSTAINMKISGRLDLKTDTGSVIKAKIEDEVIRSVLTVEPGASRQHLIQSFMSLPQKQITIRQNNIIKMEEAPPKIKTELPEEPVEEPTDFDSPPDPGFLFSSQGRKRKSSD